MVGRSIRRNISQQHQMPMDAINTPQNDKPPTPKSLDVCIASKKPKNNHNELPATSTNDSKQPKRKPSDVFIPSKKPKIHHNQLSATSTNDSKHITSKHSSQISIFKFLTPFRTLKLNG